MDAEYSHGSSESALPHVRQGENNEVAYPQVCDRCRLKKIGCDGVLPVCGNCISAKTQCTVSVKLRRKTKPRRYVRPTDDLVNRLRAENQALQDQLDARASLDISDATLLAVTSRNEPELSAIQQSQIYQRPPSRGSPSTNPPQQEARHSSHRVSDPVIKHMGRLVSTDAGVDRFAGSTTGVHFIHSAEQKYQQLFHTTEVFSESVYRLHMLPQPTSLNRRAGLVHPVQNLSPRLGVRQPRSYYLQRIDGFLRRWGSIWPVLFPRQLYEGFHRVFDHLEASAQSIGDSDTAQLHQIYLILAIDAWDNSGHSAESSRDDANEYFKFASHTGLKVAEKGDLSSLQSLVLSSIYLQLSGQHSLLTQVSGMAVRLAQSLGLHRHTRRFKFGAGELEMRNRMWWCVLTLDLLSSISYGLPKLISDADVDTDLPLDRDFDDVTVTELPLSLPGEATRFSIFLTYCRLAKIISTCIRQLYTTTMRRGAVEKILMFDRELRIWEHNFNAEFGVSDAWGGQISGGTAGQRLSADDQAFVVPYLQIMGSLAMLLVHQPALSFGPEYLQFQKSLAACVRSCMNMISIFDKNKNERRLFYLQPNAARLIFQSTLMCLYHCWHFKTSFISSEESHTEVPINHVVDTAIGLLELEVSECSRTNLGEATTQSSSAQETLSNAIFTLRKLGATTLGHQIPIGVDMSPSSVVNAGMVDQGQESNNPTNDPWQLSALNSLNQLDMLEWSQGMDTGIIDSYLLDSESSLRWL